MSTFDDDFTASALDDHFAQFARAVTFQPDRGGSRSVRGILVDRGREVAAGQVVNEDQHEIALTVRRDDSHTTDGGISSPQRRDSIRHPDEPDDAAPFVFGGSIENAHPDSWTLIFARNRADEFEP